MSTNSQRLGKYELRERLGRGGMAEVWKAFDSELERYVAIKILHADLLADPDFMSRFTREARVIASLHHPNIVQIHDFRISQPPESSSPMAYMVMDYVEGQTLADNIRNTSRIGKFPPAGDIVHLFTSISKAIDYAHHRGMIHRDIKPANILLDKRNMQHNSMGEPVLTDFGIAKLLGATSGTMSGMWLGTPLYISPEQAQGHPGNERSDIYSLGVILYEICTGVQPFRGEGIAAIMMQHINAMPTPPSLINPNIPPALTMVILRCLAKDPAARFSSASSMAAALAEAFNIPVPAELLLPSYPVEAVNEPTSPSEHLQGMSSQQPNISMLPPTPSTHLPTSTPFSLPIVGSVASSYAALSTPQSTTPPIAFSGSNTSGGSPVTRSFLQQSAILPPGSTTPTISTPPPIPSKLFRQRRGLLVALLILLIILVVSSSLGAFFLFVHNAPIASAKQVVGHAFFIGSGQIFEHSSQGINDQLQIDLYNLPDPAPGKSYYAWLLSDTKQVEWTPIFISRLTVNHGEVHYHYPGDKQFTNLLEVTSRFLITEQDASSTPSTPSLDRSMWRYYAELPQKPNPADTVHHYSVLDHLRHLLAQDPKLKALNLVGGLDIWLFRNTEKVLEWAGSSRDSWERKEPIAIKIQVTRILDYLDGKTYVQTDVPPGTPNLVNPRIAPVALLEFDTQNQTPPGYLYHISSHLEAITQAPDASPYQRKLAAQINKALDNVKSWLEKVHADARQLITMSSEQLLSQDTLSILNDMETQARGAYIGQVDPNTNQVQEGVAQIHHNIQLLATFDITPFTASTQ